MTILQIIASDSSFERTEVRGQHVWQGKCLFCNRKLLVELNGEPISAATIEHIVPRNHGGTDDLGNLALACRSCNNEKGVRHDKNKRPTDRAVEVTEALKKRRQSRWRGSL